MIFLFYRNFLSGKEQERGIKEQELIALFEMNSMKLNDKAGLFTCGLIYEEGLYVERGMKKAIHYYELATDLHHKDAQYNLGVFYDECKFVARDAAKSIHYYQLSADQGHPGAQHNLGVFYDEGEDVDQDI